MLYDNLGTNEKNHLTIGGLDTVELVEKYGTPLMVIDENRLRSRCKQYVEAVKKYFGNRSTVLFASKALCLKNLYKIVLEENLGIDVVSSGEIYTAKKADFDLSKAFFHGNNKTDEDIKFAIDSGIGYFVADNLEEIDLIDSYAKAAGIKQKILMRLTPGIDPHTHAAITTGKVDSKFGVAIETGQAEELIAHTLKKENIILKGFHCHIGSQIFNMQPFCDAASIMADFILHIKEKLGFSTEILNLGGGFGVPYTESDPDIDYTECIKILAEHLKKHCEKIGLSTPDIILEPGRSIVADSCITLYTVGAIKQIPSFKNYASIDGGMTDNPRFALYGSPYTVVLANKINSIADFNCTLAGRCCESGDIIQEHILLPKPKRGDIVAVLTTGAYNYSMASNYNRIPRPPFVFIKDGRARLTVRRETFEDMIFDV